MISIQKSWYLFCTEDISKGNLKKFTQVVLLKNIGGVCLLKLIQKTRHYDNCYN